MLKLMVWMTGSTDAVEGGEQVTCVGGGVRVTSHVIVQRVAEGVRVRVKDGAIDHAQETSALRKTTKHKY